MTDWGSPLGKELYFVNTMAEGVLRAAAALTGVAALGAGFTGTAIAGASVDGFDTESVAPANQVTGDFIKTMTSPGVQTASPTNGVSGGMPQRFVFEMPDGQFRTAGASSGGSETVMEPMTQQAPPAITKLPTASGQDVAKGMRGPQPFGGPDLMEPVSSLAAPAGPAADQARQQTNNQQVGSNHTFSLN